ncbi:MAG: hypothetical protein JZU65_05645 [Chlorobium sp.]|nr:hypothetical protein [Chlorobium sp.]
MPEQTVAVHPVDLWTALGASVTMIAGLVTYIWTRQNNDIKGISDDVKLAHSRLDLGIGEFSDIGEQLVKIGEQLKALEKEDLYESQEMDRLDLDIKLLNNRLLVLETEHKNCKARL